MEKDQKKISYFANLGAKNRTGGGYTFAQEFYHVLKRLPIELTVFAVAGPNDRGTVFPQSSQIRYVDLPAHDLSLPQAGISWAFKLGRMFKEMPAQDLYLFDQPQAAVWALPKARSAAMFHGTVLSESVSLRHPRSFLNSVLWQKPVLGSIEKRFLWKKTGIPLFNSFCTLKTILEHFPGASDSLREYVTYLPLDLQSILRHAKERDARRKSLGIEPSETLILCLSNFSTVKQAEIIPSMVQTLLNHIEKSKVRFLFIGRSIDSKPLDDFVKSPDSQGRCIRMGEVSREEAIGWQHAADIAVSTSKMESFGYALTESMAAKLPIAAFHGGAIPEIVEHEKTGFISNNPEEFCRYLEELIARADLRNKMGEAAYSRVERLFSSSVFQNRFLRILKKDFNLEFD